MGVKELLAWCPFLIGGARRARTVRDLTETDSDMHVDVEGEE